MVSNNHCQSTSNAKRAVARKKIVTITTTDARTNSSLLGQVTLFISASTAIKKSPNFGQLTTRYPNHKPIANIAAGIPGVNGEPGAKLARSVLYNDQDAIATMTQIANAVTWRTIRPWLDL